MQMKCFWQIALRQNAIQACSAARCVPHEPLNQSHTTLPNVLKGHDFSNRQVYLLFFHRHNKNTNAGHYNSFCFNYNCWNVFCRLIILNLEQTILYYFAHGPRPVLQSMARRSPRSTGLSSKFTQTLQTEPENSHQRGLREHFAPRYTKSAPHQTKSTPHHT